MRIRVYEPNHHPRVLCVYHNTFQAKSQMDIWTFLATNAIVHEQKFEQFVNNIWNETRAITAQGFYYLGFHISFYEQ